MFVSPHLRLSPSRIWLYNNAINCEFSVLRVLALTKRHVGSENEIAFTGNWYPARYRAILAVRLLVFLRTCGVVWRERDAGSKNALRLDLPGHHKKINGTQCMQKRWRLKIVPRRKGRGLKKRLEIGSTWESDRGGKTDPEICKTCLGSAVDAQSIEYWRPQWGWTILTDRYFTYKHHQNLLFET